MTGRILIVDDAEKMAALLARSLERSGYQAKGLSSSVEALELLKRETFDVLVTDLRMPGHDGLEVLRRAREIQPDIGLVLMTAYASVDTALEAMKLGAVDYLRKPISAEEQLKPLLERMLAEKKSGRPVSNSASSPTKSPRNIPQPSPGILCVSKVMIDLYAKAAKVAKSNASVLLRGESGTGKEVMADFIQSNSTRADKPYVKINCGALPETLLESELFGHVKGSFTGAVGDRAGLFETANGGTVMLDEVGEVSPALQVKLLRVLQQGEFSRVGESVSRHADARVIAATNRPLEEMVEEGSFRKDLYYRLNVVPIELPPLRERREDLKELIGHFASRFHPQGNVHFAREVLEAMEQYPWPGNIRELENAIEHAIVIGDPAHIQMDDLPAAITQYLAGGGTVSRRVGVGMIGNASLEEVEKSRLVQALEKSRGNLSAAARSLNITRRTLSYRLRKYGLWEKMNERFGRKNDD